ncbi:MAG: Bcr/CflA family efflux MFS transporter [Sphingobium sp.]|nr:Bcr/CflA family efflux MFS transporter [Sphingobium sp.]
MKRRNSPDLQLQGPPLWLLGIVTLGGTVGVHIFAPALVLAARDLHLPAASLQLTISLYIWGLALGQLIYGPLADHYGRRPVLLVGMALFTLAGTVAALSSVPETLYIARMVQALGGCAGMVIARSIVGDISNGREAVSNLARLNLLILIGPGLGPVVGGVIASIAGWRAVLVVLAVMGALGFCATFRFLPETLKPAAGRPGFVLGRYPMLLSSPIFLGYTVGGGCVTTVWYAFVSAAPFLYSYQYGLSVAHTGIHMGVIVAGAWIGNLLAARCTARYPARRVLLTGHRLCAAMAILFAVMIIGEIRSAIPITMIMFVYTCGLGLAGPALLAKVIEVEPGATGTAAGFYGFTQMAVGAIAVALIGLGGDPGWSVAAILVGSAIIAQICFSLTGREEKKRQKLT